MSVSSEIAAEPAYDGPPSGVSGSRGLPGAGSTLYGRAFWCTYLSNTALMIAISLMYRYADFVVFLGGSELTVGTIVGIGMTGSLVMRFFQGYGIDHFGPRRIWLWSLAGFSLSLLGQLLVTEPDGVAIFLLRIAYSTSVAGAFGASITSVSRSLPVARMAEVIGSLGTSGFIAMALGPQLGDFLCGHDNITRTDLNTMFYVAAALGGLALVAAQLATRDQTAPRRRRRPHVFWLLGRYHPGSVMVLGVVMGMGFVIPTTFLPTFALEHGIERTGPFFLVYAATAFITRLSTRRFPELFGVRPMVYLGLAALSVSLLCYLPVTGEWGLLVPGIFAGMAHAVLFPSATAQGSAAFPNRYRGLGTTVMLAMLDIGTLSGAPLIGAMVKTSKAFDLPPYQATFIMLAAGVAATGVFYAWSNASDRAS